MKSKILFLIVGSVLTSALAAAEDEDKPKTTPNKIPGATVTITAEADSVEVAKTPNPVIVVDADKIARTGANSLTRLLEYVFPSRAVPLGGPGTQTSLFINGARSQDTVVMIDGIRVTDTNLGLNMSNFGLTGIDRVEILLGPASTLYGSDAHGGVVSMSSAPPSEAGLSGHVLAQAGTLGQTRAGAMASYSWGTGWAQGAGDAEQSPSSIKTDLPYRQSAGHISIGQQLGDSWLVKLNHRSNYIGAPTPFDTDTGWPSGRLFDKGREALVWQSITTASVRGAFSDSIYAEVNFGSIGQENYNNANVTNSNTYSSPSHP
ncbi:MAG: TonB-dependent receptor plug domain-containing protein, partial [Holophagales bacterium]|nr:TonB-dependent receptor plug domain-containing protein [Holophagales bacterium]